MSLLIAISCANVRGDGQPAGRFCVCGFFSFGKLGFFGKFGFCGSGSFCAGVAAAVLVPSPGEVVEPPGVAGCPLVLGSGGDSLLPFTTTSSQVSELLPSGLHT